MANLSDAFGDVIVQKVGAEFLEFISKVQDGDDVYYTLVHNEDVKGLKPDENGDLSFSFGAEGRWNYGNNLNGYLKGEWLDDERKEAYNKFMQAIKDKKGLISISYSDSDTAMDWMGTGEFAVGYEDGEISFTETFIEEPLTISGFATMQGETEYWALEYIYGDEVGEAYSDYSDKCIELGTKPVTPETWMSTIYESED